jgi:hypothetical protein
LAGKVQTSGITLRLGAETILYARTESAMPTNHDDTLLPFSLPSICQRKVTAAFDGGRISSDGGVLLLAGADKQTGLIDALAAIIPDDRDPNQITHTLSDILRARIFAIACGYPDGDDLDDLRTDPAFKLAYGRLPARVISCAVRSAVHFRSLRVRSALVTEVAACRSQCSHSMSPDQRRIRAERGHPGPSQIVPTDVAV